MVASNSLLGMVTRLLPAFCVLAAWSLEDELPLEEIDESDYSEEYEETAARACSCWSVRPSARGKDDFEDEPYSEEEAVMSDIEEAG